MGERSAFIMACIASYNHTIAHTEEKICDDGYKLFIFFILMEPFLILPTALLYLLDNPLKDPC